MGGTLRLVVLLSMGEWEALFASLSLFLKGEWEALFASLCLSPKECYTLRYTRRYTLRYTRIYTTVTP